MVTFDLNQYKCIICILYEYHDTVSKPQQLIIFLYNIHYNCLNSKACLKKLDEPNSTSENCERQL